MGAFKNMQKGGDWGCTASGATECRRVFDCIWHLQQQEAVCEQGQDFLWIDSTEIWVDIYDLTLDQCTHLCHYTYYEV